VSFYFELINNRVNLLLDKIKTETPSLFSIYFVTNYMGVTAAKPC